jgi:ABC-type transport system involved in multi-copper enzyme maturation permease subunit
MNWAPVARKDVQDAVRSRSLSLLTVVFVVLVLALTLLAFRTGDREFADVLAVMFDAFAALLPILAFGVGYKAVLAERQAGTLVLALSLPHSRRDLVVGKFVGRALVLLAPVVVGLVLAGGLVLAAGGAPGELVDYLAFGALTLLYGLAFLGIAVFLSISTVSSRRATLGAVGLYIALVFGWRVMVAVLVTLLFRLQDPGPTPDWAVFVEFLSPTVLYRFLLNGIEGIESDFATMVNPPWFITWWMALFLLLAWVVVPVAIGAWRFERTEL